MYIGDHMRPVQCFLEIIVHLSPTRVPSQHRELPVVCSNFSKNFMNDNVYCPISGRSATEQLVFIYGYRPVFFWYLPHALVHQNTFLCVSRSLIGRQWSRLVFANHGNRTTLTYLSDKQYVEMASSLLIFFFFLSDAFWDFSNTAPIE